MSISHRFKVIEAYMFKWDVLLKGKICGVWGAGDPLDMHCHRRHPQKALPYGNTHRLSHQPSKSVQAFELCRCAGKKKVGKGRKGIKRDKCVIFRTSLEKSLVDGVEPNFGTVNLGPNLITP